MEYYQPKSGQHNVAAYPPANSFDQSSKPFVPSKKRLLYVDALNFSRRFFSEPDFWNLTKPVHKIKTFLRASHASGWHVEVFIDAGIESKETLMKWKTRRALQVKKCKLDVPNGLAIIYGDIWRDMGVKVHYSDIDNDDTIAAYAQAHGACLLSGDKDMYRYRGGQFVIYNDYDIVRGLLKLQNGQEFRHPKPRNIIVSPLPKTFQTYK